MSTFFDGLGVVVFRQDVAQIRANVKAREKVAHEPLFQLTARLVRHVVDVERAVVSGHATLHPPREGL